MPLSYEQRVLRVLQYIHDNPADDLSLDALAEVGLTSRFHWHRVFQALTGETCAQAVRRIRLSLAANRLINDTATVADIAANFGYPNIQSFTRAFNDRFGVPPAAFRKAGLPGPIQQQQIRGEFTMFKIELDKVPQRQLGAIKHTGAYPGIAQCFENLASMATTQNLWPQVRGMIGVYYDDPNIVGEADLRSHAGLWLSDGASVPDSLESIVLPATHCAVLHYQGPYPSIKVAYDYLYGNWLPNSGAEPADAPPYEVYLNSQVDTDEADLLTDIILPLAS